MAGLYDNDWTVKRLPGGRAEERRAAEREDAAVTGDHSETVRGSSAYRHRIDGNHARRWGRATTRAVRIPREHIARVGPIVRQAGHGQR